MPMTIEAFKVSGGGNDFIALAEPEARPSAELVRAWCVRRMSIGADGVFVIRRRSGGVAMRHLNADGGVAELCVNGTRCAALLAFELGWADDRVTILTDSGPIEADLRDSGTVGLSLAAPGLPAREIALEAAERTWSGWYLTVGVPHLVLPWESTLAEARVAEIGPLLRAHPELGEGGANVDFVRYRPPDGFEIRTWERGVEGETLACGSGVLAGAVVGAQTDRCRMPITALTRGGFEIEVEGAFERDRLTSLSLAGDARLVSRLTITAGASSFPSPARWR